MNDYKFQAEIVYNYYHSLGFFIEQHNFVTWFPLTVAHRQSLTGVLCCHELNLDSDVPHWALTTAEVQTFWVNIEQIPTMTGQKIRERENTVSDWQAQNHGGVNETLILGWSCLKYSNTVKQFLWEESFSSCCRYLRKVCNVIILKE